MIPLGALYLRGVERRTLALGVGIAGRAESKPVSEMGAASAPSEKPHHTSAYNARWGQREPPHDTTQWKPHTCNDTSQAHAMHVTNIPTGDIREILAWVDSKSRVTV